MIRRAAIVVAAIFLFWAWLWAGWWSPFVLIGAGFSLAGSVVTGEAIEAIDDTFGRHFKAARERRLAQEGLLFGRPPRDPNCRKINGSWIGGCEPHG